MSQRQEASRLRQIAIEKVQVLQRAQADAEVKGAAVKVAQEQLNSALTTLQEKQQAETERRAVLEGYQQELHSAIQQKDAELEHQFKQSITISAEAPQYFGETLIGRASKCKCETYQRISRVYHEAQATQNYLEEIQAELVQKRQEKPKQEEKVAELKKQIEERRARIQTISQKGLSDLSVQDTEDMRSVLQQGLKQKTERELKALEADLTAEDIVLTNVSNRVERLEKELPIAQKNAEETQQNIPEIIEKELRQYAQEVIKMRQEAEAVVTQKRGQHETLETSYTTHMTSHQGRPDAILIESTLNRLNNERKEAERDRQDAERDLAQLQDTENEVSKIVQTLDGVQEATEKATIAEQDYTQVVKERENAETIVKTQTAALEKAEGEARIANEALQPAEKEAQEADRLATQAEDMARKAEEEYRFETYKQSVETLFVQNDYLKDKVTQNYLIDDAFFNHAIEKGFTPEQICFLLEAHYRINDDSFKTEHIQKMQSLGLSGNTLFYYGFNERSLLYEAVNSIGPAHVDAVRLLLNAGVRVENADIICNAIPSYGFSPERREILTMLLQQSPAEFLQDKNVFLKALSAEPQVFEFLQQNGMEIPQNAEEIINNSRNGDHRYKQELLNRLSNIRAGKPTTMAILSANAEQSDSQKGLMATLREAENGSEAKASEEILLGINSQNSNC